MSARIVKHGIPDLAADLLRLHSSMAYLQHYEFFDNIARVSRTESDDLFTDLYRRLYSGQTNGVGLAPPEVFNDEDTIGYALGTQPPDPAAFTEASPHVLSQELSSKATFDAAVVRVERLRLWAIPSSGGEIPNWPVRRCLTFEDPGSTGPRVLFNGNWWAAAQAFADRINRFTNSLPRATLQLPVWDKNTHATELLYNTKVAADNGWGLMDQKTVQVVGRSRIEVCDLLTPQRDLVHVKSYGGSSVLSHLFAQGTTSAEVIREEPTTRTEARTHLGPAYEHLIPDAATGLDPSDFRVVYAIAAVGSGPVDDVLPFFSRVHLRKHAIMLERLGFGLPKVQRFELLPKV